jgi:hypothetical protein
MKILFIFTEDEAVPADGFRPLLEKMGISDETLLLKSPKDSGAKRQFSDLLKLVCPEEKDNAPTHMCILSAIGERWIDFLAGFSCGAHLPLLVYGEEAIESIPVEFTSFFRILKTENSLRDYLASEYEAHEKWETARELIKARDALLAMGIPTTGEALVNCAGVGGIREVSLFLAAGFSPDTRDKAGVPLLNIAARKGNWEILRLLLQADAQIDLLAEDRGTSALIDSVMGKKYDIANDLVKAGADVNIQSKAGQTALIVAVGADDEKMVETLLKAGADPEIADNMGMNARQYAELFHRDAISSLFNTLTPPKAE